MTVAYLLGPALSAAAGVVSISITPAFMAGFRGGAVMGMAVVASSLPGTAALCLFTGSQEIILAFSFGASSPALFAKAGGGIFTKTADISADLAGKGGTGHTGGRPRNIAEIADNAGALFKDAAGLSLNTQSAAVPLVSSLCEGLFVAASLIW